MHCSTQIRRNLKCCFLLQNGRRYHIDQIAHGFIRPQMIVCSCNVLSADQVRTAIAESAPRSAVYVHRCLGCSAQCGRCMRTIKRIMDEALAPCPAGCTCSRHAAED